MWARTDDPERDFEDYDRDCARRECEWVRPCCNCCDKPITTDKALYVDGYWYCADCEEPMKEEVWQDFRREHMEEV